MGGSVYSISTQENKSHEEFIIVNTTNIAIFPIGVSLFSCADLKLWPRQYCLSFC